MPVNDGRVRAMTIADVAPVVLVHLAAFPSFFLSRLGARFLTLFYLGLLGDPSGIALVYTSAENSLCGFVGGAMDPGGFYSRLRRRQWWRFGLAVVPVILRAPSTLKRILRGAAQATATARDVRSAGLFSLGVDPATQGRGAGAGLVDAFVEAVRTRSGTSIVLTTDAHGNEAVNRFYVARGFTLSQNYQTAEGRVMHEYRLSLAVTPPIMVASCR